MPLKIDDNGKLTEVDKDGNPVPQPEEQAAKPASATPSTPLSSTIPEISQSELSSPIKPKSARLQRLEEHIEGSLGHSISKINNFYIRDLGYILEENKKNHTIINIIIDNIISKIRY